MHFNTTKRTYGEINARVLYAHDDREYSQIIKDLVDMCYDGGRRRVIGIITVNLNMLDSIPHFIISRIETRSTLNSDHLMDTQHIPYWDWEELLWLLPDERLRQVGSPLAEGVPRHYRPTIDIIHQDDYIVLGPKAYATLLDPDVTMDGHKDDTFDERDMDLDSGNELLEAYADQAKQVTNDTHDDLDRTGHELFDEADDRISRYKRNRHHFGQEATRTLRGAVRDKYRGYLDVAWKDPDEMYDYLDHNRDALRQLAPEFDRSMDNVERMYNDLRSDRFDAIDRSTEYYEESAHQGAVGIPREFAERESTEDTIERTGIGGLDHLRLY